MGGKVLPIRVMREIEKSIAPTHQIQKIIFDYPPDVLAMALGPASPLPNAWTALLWASHACQDARHHLYLAHHDRFYYSSYRKHTDKFTGDAQAVMFFSSFSLNAIAAENHLALAALLADGGHFRSEWAPGLSKVAKKVKPELAALLQPLLNEKTDWQWVRSYRERWFHNDPVRVKEMGDQWRVASDRSFWVRDPANKTMSIGFGGGDAPEISVDELLEKGRSAFSTFARQYGLIVVALVERARRDWHAWTPGGFGFKKPRRRPISWLKA